VLRINTSNESDKPLAGVEAQLKSKGTVVRTITTNEKGDAEFVDIAPGTYEVAITKEGFEPLTQSDIVVTAGAPLEIKFTLSPKIALSEAVTITDRADAPLEKGASPAAELQRTQIKETPLRPATVTDTLPLVPGVVRSADGEVKISASGEHRSALIVNSADVTDPATGQFGMTVPVDSVETISVFKTPYLAQFGRFTAGIVSVETRRGGDKWSLELNDPPSPRYSRRRSSRNVQWSLDKRQAIFFGGVGIRSSKAAGPNFAFSLQRKKEGVGQFLYSG